VYAENNDGSGLYPTMVVANFAPRPTTRFSRQVLQHLQRVTALHHRYFGQPDLYWVVSGVVQADDGRQTAIYAMQSAENWLEDAGSGQLSAARRASNSIPPSRKP